MLSLDKISDLLSVFLPLNTATGRPYMSFALSISFGVTRKFFIIFILNNSLNAFIPGDSDVKHNLFALLASSICLFEYPLLLSYTGITLFSTVLVLYLGLN